MMLKSMKNRPPSPHTGIIKMLCFFSAGNRDRARDEAAGAVGAVGGARPAGEMALPSQTLTGVVEEDTAPPRLADILVACATIEG